MGTNMLGRTGGSMTPYGSGMLLNTDTSSSKVGKLLLSNQSKLQLTLPSYPPLRMSLT
jgi:hypothetical protein